MDSRPFDSRPELRRTGKERKGKERRGSSVGNWRFGKAKEEERRVLDLRSRFENWGGGHRRKMDGIGARADHVTWWSERVDSVVEKRALSRWGCSVRAAGRPGALFSPRRTRAHTQGIINICYCTYIRAGRPVSPPPPATGRTLNTLSPCLHMVRAWNRAVESERSAIDPRQWDRAVFVPRQRPSSFLSFG